MADADGWRTYLAQIQAAADRYRGD
jgi:hypothetical protein